MRSESPHDRRLQSHTLTWLNQQRLRWRDRLQQGWRSLQIATAWTAQIALYPFYLAVQASRLLLGQGRSSSQEHPQALGGDGLKPDMAPVSGTGSLVTSPGGDLVTQVLQGLDQDPNLQFHPHADGLGIPAIVPQVQGLASLRIPMVQQGVGSLVWVDDRNRLWTMLPHQQEAVRYHLVRLLSQAPAPLDFLDDRPQQLPPVRWFRRLMTWMQTSPLAIATNLFQEAEQAPPLLPPFPNPLPPKLQHHMQVVSQRQSMALLRLLDDQLAQWELPLPEHNPPPASPPPLTLRESTPTPTPDPPSRITPKLPALSWESPNPPPQPLPPLLVSLPLPEPNTSQDPDDAWVTEIQPPQALDAVELALVGMSPGADPRSEPVDPPFILEIEVGSESLGYDRHPLEYLLHWIDRLLSWLEQKLSQFQPKAPK